LAEMKQGVKGVLERRDERSRGFHRFSIPLYPFVFTGDFCSFVMRESGNFERFLDLTC
jgi:hypothetical protein